MNSSQIKLIAIITMLIDHIGASLFPNIIWLRIIGRLAFPIFAYFIAEGYFRTHNLKKYMTRLGIFALISQYPYYLHHNSIWDLNIFFTLLIGLFAIDQYEKTNNIRMVWFLGFVAQALNTDYGLYGVFTVYIFYKYRSDFKALVKKQIILNFYFLLVLGILVLLGGINDKQVNLISELMNIGIQSISLISLFILKKYNGQKGVNLKYLFYVFYPAHLLILHLIKPFVR